MSTSKKKVFYNLTIRISEEYKYLVNISIFDSSSRIIESKTSVSNPILFNFSQGLYTLRIEINGNVKDDIILLDKSLEYFIGNEIKGKNIIKIAPPIQYSSALLEGTYGFHEYYSNPAIEWSKKNTNLEVAFSGEINNSLFIFLRFPSVEKFDDYNKTKRNKKNFYDDFELRDEEGKILTKFISKNGIEYNESHGWVALNVKLPNGIYYLIYKGEESRQIPIYVFKNWHTQFFMTLSSTPLFGTIRIFLSSEREFKPNNKLSKYIDILLDKLQNQDYTLNREVIDITSDGKYESPMLGIICSYIYLKSKEKKDDALFQLITDNIKNLILKDNSESPDLKALNILASNHFSNYKYNNEGILSPPMLRIGFETILNASIEKSNLIPENSVNDFISENIYYDSPFNTFKPFPFPKKSKAKQVISDDFLSAGKKIAENLNLNISLNLTDKNQNLNSLVFGASKLIFKDWSPEINRYSSQIVDVLGKNALSLIENTNQNKNSWIKNSVIEILKQDKTKTIYDISRELNISGNTINRIVGELTREPKTKKLLRKKQ